MPQTKKHQIADRRRKVSDFYLKGYSQYAIADKLGVTRQLIGHDIKTLHKEWSAQNLDDVGKARQRELLKLDNLEQTYWDAWFKSIEDYKQKTVKASGSGKAKKPEKIERTEKDMIAYGNPSFLAGVDRCIERRCKILGIDAPIKTESKIEGVIIQVKNDDQKKLIEDAG
jgi:predicted DNA-binding protein YlxM (UPF0122 family)